MGIEIRCRSDEEKIIIVTRIINHYFSTIKKHDPVLNILNNFKDPTSVIDLHGFLKLILEESKEIQQAINILKGEEYEAV